MHQSRWTGMLLVLQSIIAYFTVMGCTLTVAERCIPHMSVRLVKLPGEGIVIFLSSFWRVDLAPVRHFLSHLRFTTDWLLGGARQVRMDRCHDGAGGLQTKCLFVDAA